MTLFPLENEFFAGRRPGCYNDPDFRALEAKDPQGTLQSYARFVVTRAMSTSEADYVRAAVPHVVSTLLDRASRTEIARNCYAASMACLQTLEANGIWGFVLTGSVRFRFPLGSGLREQCLPALADLWVPDGPRTFLQAVGGVSRPDPASGSGLWIRLPNLAAVAGAVDPVEPGPRRRVAPTVSGPAWLHKSTALCGVCIKPPTDLPGEPNFFWHNDGARAGHKAGHAWLVIPPFQLIDVTASYQGWSGREASFLPNAIVMESVTKRPFLQDLAAPPEHRKGYHVSPVHREFWKVFPPFEVDADRTQVFYQPYGVTIPAESLAESVLVLGERRAAQFVTEEIQPGLSALIQR